MSLQDYIQDCSSLLFDYGLNFTPRAQLIRWINESRRQVAFRTGCIRRHLTGQSAYGAGAQPGSFIPGAAQPGQLPNAQPNAQNSAPQGNFQMIVGAERYPYQGFANPILQAQHAGCEGIVDVGMVSVSWGGSPLPALAWLPWEDLQAYARAYQNLVTSYPYYWSVLNDGANGEVWLFPVPSQPGDQEWDVFCYPKSLYSNDDFDALPEERRNTVKFGATSLALMSKRQYADAEYMQQKFAERLGISTVAADGGKTPNFYYDPF